MAVVDTEKGTSDVKDQVTRNKKYKQFKEGVNNLKKKAGSALEKSKTKTTSTLSNAKKFSKKNQRPVKNLFDNLLDINVLSNDRGGQVAKYLKRLFVKSLNELKSKIIELLTKDIVKSIGCSVDQIYNPGQILYIRVQSVDLLKLLMTDPSSEVGKISYEQKNLQYTTFPFSMNKALYERTQNLNQPFSDGAVAGTSYKGISGQDLFDITYVESYWDPIGGQTIQGNFFKVELKARLGAPKVVEFLLDYFKSIEIIDFKNIFANLMNLLTGAISIQKGDGVGDLDMLEKALIIMNRLLGVCPDNTKEINVGGTAKVSPSDNIDDSFFEFTDIDLREIDTKINNIKLGVVEFEDCDVLKLPVDNTSIIDAINNLNFIEGGNNNNTIENATNITDILTDNPDWFPIKINIDFTFLKEFPKAIILSILTPKILLPIMIVVKALGQNIADTINSIQDFIKNFKTFFFNLVQNIQEIFLKILFETIVKDIKNLIKSIGLDILEEKARKIYDMILSLTKLVINIISIFTSFKECRNVIDELLRLLELATKGVNNVIPLPLLMTSKLLSGYSSTRAFLNVIDEFEKYGLPTGPGPDGSPNMMLAAMKAMLDGQDKEESQNGQVQIAAGPFSITPIGLTVPAVAYGKKL
jgi:hypothetical protein